MHPSDEYQKHPGKKGRSITFYVPGAVRYNGTRGRYRAVSITGRRCDLKCGHCRGVLLESMISAEKGEELKRRCRELAERGDKGVLISGGCDRDGRLPWKGFLSVIEDIKNETGLYISIHSGLVTADEAKDLKRSGVDQALIDVIGDDDTYREICHVDFGISRIMSAMEALEHAELPMVPHIVCGLYNGRIRSEKKAVDMVRRFKAEQLVIVSLMNLGGDRQKAKVMPDSVEVSGIIAYARALMPDIPISLGCARERGNRDMELKAIEAGVDKMALPSDEAIAYSEAKGLDVTYQDTCCSVPYGAL
jgi:uncharacterized radical SAM superfamily protein